MLYLHMLTETRDKARINLDWFELGSFKTLKVQ